MGKSVAELVAGEELSKQDKVKCSWHEKQQL